MKKLLLVVTSVLILTTAYGQNSPASLQWERSQNGVASTTNYFLKAKNDIGGNIYSLSESDGDMLVVKFNSATQVQQSFRYNNPSNATDYPKDFDVDAAGNVYISGSSYVDFKYTMTVVKFDPNGNQLWELNYLPSNQWVYPTEVSANAMCLDAGGNIYFTGAINDSLIAVKVNASGTVLWATKISNSGNYYGSGNDIAVDAFNSVYLAGKSKNAGGNFDAVAVKLNASGVQQWIKTINGASGADDHSVSVGLDNSSNMYVSSMIADAGAADFTPYLTKYNASGAQQWQKTFYTAGQVNAEAVKLIVDNLGNTYFGMHVQQVSNMGYAHIYKHTASGVQSYATMIDESTQNDNHLTDIYVDANANLYATGRFQGTGSLFYTKLNPAGTISLNLGFNHGGANNLYDKAWIVAEQSGFFNVLTAAVQVYNARFNNLGVFLYEGVYAGSANTADGAVKIFAQGNNSVYGLGYVTNDISGMDAVISKYDNAGNILWQNIIDNNQAMDEPYDMAKDSVFNIYIAKRSNTGSEIVKYDSIGSPAWIVPANTRYKKIKVANGGNIYLAGDEGPFGNAYINFTVAKIDPSANFVYQSNASNDMAYSLRMGDMGVDSLERITVAGTLTYHAGQPDQKIAVIVEKFSTAGNLLWHKQVSLIDSTSGDALTYTRVTRVLVDGNNDIYVQGTTYTNAGFGHGAMFIDKFNANGTLAWHHTYDDNGNWSEAAGDMRLLSSGPIIAYSSSQNSQILRRIGAGNGAIVWETPVYAGPSSEAASMQLDANNDIFFVGNAVYNSTRDVVLGKMSAAGTLYWMLNKAGSAAENDFGVHLDVTNTGRIYVGASMANNSGSSKDFSILKFCDIAQPSLISVGATQGLCSGSNVTLSVIGSTTYLWSDLSTTNDTLVATATGDYFCTAYKNDGCFKNSDTVSVQFKTPPPTPQICAVTVDTLSTHNIILWDKSGITGATAFNIYREDVTNVYSYIGTVVYDSLSEFHDYGANPNVTTKRYKISAIDSCGQESPMSNYHNTIYIVSNGSGQFSWNPIYTIENSPNPVTQYLLMREDVAGSGILNQVASTAGTQFIVNDPDYALYPNGSWRVFTDWDIVCTPTRGAINTSRSNIKSPTSIGLNETTAGMDFLLSPNPAHDQLTIKTSRFDVGFQVNIYNTLGQKIMAAKLSSNETQLDISALEAGTYFIQIEGKYKSAMKKLIRY